MLLYEDCGFLIDGHVVVVWTGKMEAEIKDKQPTGQSCHTVRVNMKREALMRENTSGFECIRRAMALEGSQME